MPIYDVIFYFFAVTLVLSALGVVSTKNAVTSVLFLVLSFFSSSVLWMMLHAEFLSLVLIFLYVGAVMVLFLFVLMMIDFRSSLQQQSSKVYTLLALIFLVVFSVIVSLALISQHLPKLDMSSTRLTMVGNTQALGQLLYTRFVYEFEIVGAILLVAIVAAISLSQVFPRRDTKHQNVDYQHAAKKEHRLKIIKMESEK